MGADAAERLALAVAIVASIGLVATMGTVAVPVLSRPEVQAYFQDQDRSITPVLLGAVALPGVLACTSIALAIKRRLVLALVIGIPSLYISGGLMIGMVRKVEGIASGQSIFLLFAILAGLLFFATIGALVVALAHHKSARAAA